MPTSTGCRRGNARSAAGFAQSRDPTVPDPDGIINQGHGNATARAVQIYEGDQINEAALLAMLRAVIGRNRAGGWRRLKD